MIRSKNQQNPNEHGIWGDYWGSIDDINDTDTERLNSEFSSTLSL